MILRGATSKLVTLVVALSIVLLQLPVLLGHRTLTSLLVLVVFVVCIFWAVPRFTGQLSAGIACFLALFLVLIVFALVRGAEQGVSAGLSQALATGATYVALAVLAGAAIAASANQRERRERIVAVALAPAIFALVNAVAHLGGLIGTAIEFQGIGTLQSARTLQLVGVYTNRVQFPLALAVNDMGTVAGAGLASCLLLWRSVSGRIIWPCVLGCGYCLLWGDNRVSLISAVVVAVYLGWSKRLMGVKYLAVGIPLLPLLMVAGANVLSGPFSSVFSRSTKGGDFSTLGDRLYVWQAVEPYINHFGYNQLFGWGTNGHVTSGASLHYAYQFAGLRNPALYSSHNLVLQTILETGYVGLFVLTMLALFVTARLVSLIRISRDTCVAALLAIFAVILLGGATEGSPTSGSTDVLGVMLLVCGAAVALRRPDAAVLVNASASGQAELDEPPAVELRRPTSVGVPQT